MNLEIMIPPEEPVRLRSTVLGELDYRRLTAKKIAVMRMEANSFDANEFRHLEDLTLNHGKIIIKEFFFAVEIGTGV